MKIRDPIKNAQGLATYEKILESAGKLFSTLGYDGVGVRNISDDSGIGLSTIIYHFKSKENIYLECIRHYVLNSAGLDEHFKPLFAIDVSDRQELSNALRDTMRNFLAACHGKNRVEYLNGLYFRILSDGFPEALMMLLECFTDVQKKLPEWVAKVCPDKNEVDIAFWVQLFWSQLQYTVTGKSLILYDMKQGDDFSEEYMDAAAWHFAYYCTLPLGLPEPEAFDAHT